MNEIATEEITEQQMLAYLRVNPTFLQKYPELLVYLDINHNVDGAVSLVERQVKALREQNRELQGKLIELLKTAQDNEQLFSRCTELFKRWLRDPNPNLIINNASDDIRELFTVDVVRLLLNSGSESQQASTVCKQLKVTFPDSQTLCGPCDLTTSQWLFSSGESYKSMALIPIGKGAENGLLILGSKSKDGFKATMGTLFLNQIGSVLSSLLK